MIKIQVLKIFNDLSTTLRKRISQKYKLVQLSSRKSSCVILNLSIAKMADVPSYSSDASRKRCLTPISNDIRTVIQKKEGNFIKSDGKCADGSRECVSKANSFISGEEETQQHCHLHEGELSNLFSEPSDEGLEANALCLHVKTQNKGAVTQKATFNPAMKDMANQTCSFSGSSCSEVQDMDVGDGDTKGHQKLLEITTRVKVSKSTFAKLKAMDDICAAKLAETGCVITLPRKPSKPVEILGSTKEEVQKACKLLKSGLTAEKSERPQLTHFVSIRLTQALVLKRFEEFRERVRDLQPDQDLLPDRLFQRPEKLHMSLSMLSLADDAARELAGDVLEDCCRELREQPPPNFRLRGLGVFGSATRTRVLFSRPEPAEQLQAAAEMVHSRLCDAGLAQRQQGGLTLHATLLNTTFLTRGAAGRRWRNFRGFDHTQIVEQLGEFDFGEVRLEALEISSLTGKDSDGYYARIGRGLLQDAVAVPTEGSEKSPDADDAQSGVACSVCPGYEEDGRRPLEESSVTPPSSSQDASSCSHETLIDTPVSGELESPSPSEMSPE